MAALATLDAGVGLAGLQILPVVGDRNTPDLRPGRNFVVIAPVHRFEYDGVYVVDEGMGELSLRLCSTDFKGGIVLSGYNKLYSDQVVPKERFDRDVAGIVVAEIKSKDERRLKAAWAARHQREAA